MQKIFVRDIINELYSKFTSLDEITKLISSLPEEENYIKENIRAILQIDQPNNDEIPTYRPIKTIELYKFINLELTSLNFSMSLNVNTIKSAIKLSKLKRASFEIDDNIKHSSVILLVFLKFFMKMAKNTNKLNELCLEFVDSNENNICCMIYKDHYYLSLPDNRDAQIQQTQQKIDKLVTDNIKINYTWGTIRDGITTIVPSSILCIFASCMYVDVLNEIVKYIQNFGARGYVLKHGELGYDYKNEDFQILTLKISELTLDENIEVFDILLYPDDNFEKIISKLPKVHIFTVLYTCPDIIPYLENKYSDKKFKFFDLPLNAETKYLGCDHSNIYYDYNRPLRETDSNVEIIKLYDNITDAILEYKPLQ